MSKSRPSLKVDTVRSRSQSGYSQSSNGLRSRSLSPPPSSIISAAPTLIASGFGSLTESSASRLSLVMTRTDNGSIHDPSDKEWPVSFSSDSQHLEANKEALPRKSIGSASAFNIPPSLYESSSTSPVPRRMTGTVRSREAKSSLGFYCDTTRPSKFAGNKHLHFHVKNGQKLHIYDREKVHSNCLERPDVANPRLGSLPSGLRQSLFRVVRCVVGPRTFPLTA